jgi:hypothetical protein
MYAPLSRFVEPTYATLRIVAGLLFAFHGAQKSFGMFDGTARALASLIGLAGIIEFAGGMLIMIDFAGPSRCVRRQRPDGRRLLSRTCPPRWLAHSE